MVEAMLAACLAMIVTLLAGRPLLAELRRRKLGDSYSGEEPEQYASKAGTLTMGGLMFLAGLTVAAVPLAIARDADMLLPFGVMLAGAALGAFDDMQTLHGRQKLTGHERWFFFVKWAVLLGIGSVMAGVLYFDFDLEDIVVPHYGGYSLGAIYLAVVVAVFVIATSGAVITDGMDGLMAGVSAIAYAAYGAIALTQGQDELGAFAFSVAGAVAGFLWYNAYPAQVFMGDLGSQALSVGIVAIAFMTGWWLLLPVICVVFVAEGLSDVIQIGYFKATKGRRVFKMAPIHYHFQLSGWPETQVVTRFWIVGMLGGFAGIALAMVD
ncbi:MAG TPA: phospho-N-acetylmuramoyl-pentapeptide-transferase [Dehalococcoidia bacterium]|jgi:phospho-N-acetylmuramoyl-pentapeptide-transferase|nr:phospho-N-acetylmuramoyl-pentapeptide-transferase [Dehalococcoidia bacterium]